MIFNVLQCIMVSLSFGLVFDIPHNNIVPLLIGIMYGLLLEQRNDTDTKNKETVVVGVTSVLFTLFFICGQVENILRFEKGISCILSLSISFVGAFLFWARITKRAFLLLSRDEMVFNNTQKKLCKPIVIFGGSLFILLLVWGFQFLMDYPGIVGVDTVENLEQAIGSRKMDVLFPFYMTLYLRFCWNIGIVLWGSANAGIALYSVTQIFILALSVAYLLFCIYKFRVKPIIFVLSLVYFALLPYHAHGGYMLLKDTPYAIGTMLFILSLWEFYICGIPEKKIERIWKYLLFLCAGVMMALSRANGYYVFIFCLPFLVLLFYKREKGIVGLIVFLFILIVFVRGPISDWVISQNNKRVDETGEAVFDIRYKEGNSVSGQTNVSNTKNIVQENNANANYGASGIYIITSQQLGRIAVDRELTDEEYDLLSKVINVEGMKETYNRYIVTNAMKQIKSRNMKEYLSVWVEFGLRYPYTYFIAWRDQTQGYWDPNMYTGEFDLDFCDRNQEVYRDSLFPARFVSEWNGLYEVAMEKIPLLPLFWSNGFIICITFFAMLLTAVKRSWVETFLFMPLVGLWLTLLVANPCNGQFRYVYSFFLCLPLTLLIPFVKQKSEEKEDESLLYK